MINIQKLIEEANENGYKGVKASAKVCQDIVLKALSIGPMNRNITVKGGVVMRSKTNNVRRATQDLDIDFKVIGEVNNSNKIQITLSNGEVKEIENRGYNHYVS